MMNEKKQELFKDVLTKPYDHQAYVRFLQEFFNKMQLVAPGKFNKAYGSVAKVVEGHYHIGNYSGSDGKKMALLAIQLKNEHNVENARSTQRSFIKSLLDSSNCDGAMASFYTMDKGASGELAPSDKWRLSFIRMEYGFAKGKISQTLTPAKRYSYLVGKEEPCHTAQERLYPLFEQDDEMLGLDELENAFSVEAVTKQFYNAYRDKYLQVKEYLDENEEFVHEAKYHGFTSEQFTKKLMGQIVFLYFIQKKGWLGVDAFPTHMTERQYKDAFFRNSQSRSLIGRVYSAPDTEGWAYLNMQELFCLNDEDAKFVASLVPGKAWGEGAKNFMRVLFDSCEKQGKNYFDDYLEPLFYEALNVNRGEKGYYPRFHRRVPFLNGGLFEQLENYDWQHNNFDIPNELFSNCKTKGKDEAEGILDVFDRYNFTMAEDEPMEREVAIDPEMLGKVFENLLDVKDRKSKGAFYTPREIVHYMCQESLINYLASNTGIADEDIRKFILYGEYFCDSDTTKKQGIKDDKCTYEIDKNRPLEIPASIFSFTENVNRIKELDNLLANVKIVDPAVGSGAFLLGLLNEIVKARQTLTAYIGIEMNGFERLNLYAYGRKAYDLKVLTIKNSLFACDLEPSATDITKLRLWLSIVIDDETVEQATSNGLFDEHTQPRQLPNLDCNILCGNSLMDEFEGIKLITESNLLNNQAKAGMNSFYQTGFDTMLKELVRLQDELYFTKDHETKHEIKQKIQEIYDRCILHQLEASPAAVEAYQKMKTQPSKPFVLWQLYFPKVFMEKRGFDIVIGNPPYIGESGHKEIFRPIANTEFGKKFYQGKMDFFYFFFDKGIDLLHTKGLCTLITTNYYLNAAGAKKLRNDFKDRTNIIKFVNFNELKIFQSALGQHNIITFLQKYNHQMDVQCCSVNTKGFADAKKLQSIISWSDANTTYFKIKGEKLYDTQGNILFHSDDSILAKMKEKRNFFLDKTEVGSGVDILQEYVLHKHLEINQNLILGRGIFALKDEEIPSLHLFENENEILKPYYTAEQIKRYTICGKNKKWILYTDKSVCDSIDSYPHIKKHLDQYADIITSANAPYGLHRARKIAQFMGVKILSLRMTKRPCFTYSNIDTFVTRAYLTIKPQKRVNMKYLTALFNSNLFYYWLFYNGKRKGKQLQIDQAQIVELPIFIPGVEMLDAISEKFDLISQRMLTNTDYEEIENEINTMLYKIYDIEQDEVNRINQFLDERKAD